MNLYVWHGVLTDYTDGVMFALAESEEQARQLIWDGYAMNRGGDLLPWPVPKGLRNCLYRELMKNPCVYDKPVGFDVWGGG